MFLAGPDPEGPPPRTKSVKPHILHSEQFSVLISWTCWTWYFCCWISTVLTIKAYFDHIGLNWVKDFCYHARFVWWKYHIGVWGKNLKNIHLMVVHFTTWQSDWKSFFNFICSSDKTKVHSKRMFEI
jgi:hypothetical protein